MKCGRDLHLHHLADQQVAIPERAPPLSNRRRGQVALRQKIAAQAVTDLVGIDAIVFLFRGGNGPQHQRMCYLQRRGMCLQEGISLFPAL